MTEKEIKKVIVKAVKVNNISTYRLTKEGVSHNTYKRWVEGKGTITLKTAVKLAGICNFTVGLFEIPKIN